MKTDKKNIQAIKRLNMFFLSTYILVILRLLDLWLFTFRAEMIFVYAFEAKQNGRKPKIL